MEMKIIGSKIAEARKKLGISQAELAEQLFISPQGVGKWERGESIPDLITFNRLAKVLGVDLNYFSEDFGTATADAISFESLTKVEPASAKQENRHNWNMSRGNWVDADFSGLQGLHEKFSSSNMQRCKFIGSDMSGLLLKNNNVNGCDFSQSNFNNCHIQTSNLSGNVFKNCTLKDAEFSGSYITGCDFSGADLTGATIRSGGFEKCSVTNTIWNRTSFIETYLADTVFEGNIESCYFENCSFARVTFKDAKLINTFFKNKSLKRVEFIDCQADRMTYEFLKNGKADLAGITLLTE